MTYDLLEFTPTNRCLSVISEILVNNNYSMLNCNKRKHYESVSDDENKRFFLSLEEGRLIFKYNSLESKEQNKGVLKKLEQSLLEHAETIK
ncbi:MAG: hypothetical protein AABX80_01360 [Nanoarchaeota archaeon]